MDPMQHTQTMPIPIVDRDSQPFWDACNKGELRIERCCECGHYRYPPRPMCPECRSFQATWEHISGRGTVYSWVIVHHPVHPLVRDKVPYILVLVELEEGPRMVSRLVGASSEVLREGLPVEVVFEPVAPGILLPHFRSVTDVPETLESQTRG